MQRVLVVLTLMLAMGEAPAQHVHKCLKDKNVSYQSTPCDSERQTVKQWVAIPDPTPSAQDIERQRSAITQVKRESASRRVRSGRSGAPVARRSRATGVSISAARDGERCAAAKRRRDATERRLGLSRTFETMQKLSTMIYEACR